MASLLHIATPGAGTDGRIVNVSVDSSLAMAIKWKNPAPIDMKHL